LQPAAGGRKKGGAFGFSAAPVTRADWRLKAGTAGDVRTATERRKIWSFDV